MVICDRCRSEKNNEKVCIDLGISIEQNFYNKLATQYSKDLCHGCQQDLLTLVNQYFLDNPKVPKERKYFQHEVDQMIKDALAERKSDLVNVSADDDIPF